MSKKNLVKINPDSAPNAADDRRWMRSALALARRGEGRTAPNPAVGCVIIKDNRLLGRGWTQPGGRPHAETIALAESGHSARGATAYVTLEPCAHHGKTPPCSTALISAGIGRVVIAVTDPDERVAGRGVAALEAAGIAVTTGVLEDSVRDFLAGYLIHRLHHRPLVTAKIATSLDGRIALADGRSQWITAPESRRLVHLMRSRHDAMLTTAATVRADDPALTCRLPGLESPPPLRVVVSTDLDLNGDYQLSRDGLGPVLHLHSGNAPATPGIDSQKVAADPAGKPDLTSVMQALGERGITSVMVEAGGRFMASLIRAGLVDRLIWMRSASIIGGDGLPSIAELDLEHLEQGRIFRRREVYPLGPDTVEVIDRTPQQTG